MGLNLKKTLMGIARIAASTNPLTAVLADTLLPARVAKATGEDPDIVEKVIAGIQGDKEFQLKQMEHEQAMAEIQTKALALGSENLRALDTGAEFSFWKGLLGSPRRLGVTLLSVAMSYLIISAGTRALFVGQIARDVAGFTMILKFGGATLFGLASAYVTKNFSRAGS